MSTQSPEIGGALADLEAEYEFLEEIGRGGMAVVYRARERTLGREVAVKVIHARYADDAEVLARFSREAKLAARLEHPHVVRVYTVRNLPNATLALVMEYIPGTTLKNEILRFGALPVDRAERVLREVASALACAHAHGIIHRDVKPDNIFIDRRDGRALLADFGIARPIAPDAQLTVGGMAMGTPAYMAPEQIDGRALDGRCDLYGLGLVGWEMLTGEAPWEGESFYSVLHKQKTAELTSLRRLRPDVPPRLRAVIEGAIRKEPSARWASAEEFIERLEEGIEPDWRGRLRQAADRVRSLVRSREPSNGRHQPAAAGQVETVLYRRGGNSAPGLVPSVASAALPFAEPDKAEPVPVPWDERKAWLRLPRLLQRVLEHGERVTISREGEPAWALVPAADAERLAHDDFRVALEQRRLSEWTRLREMLERRTLADAGPGRHPLWELYPGAAADCAVLVSVGGLNASAAREVMAAYGSLEVLLADSAGAMEGRTRGVVTAAEGERLLARLRELAGRAEISAEPEPTLSEAEAPPEPAG